LNYSFYLSGHPVAFLVLFPAAAGTGIVSARLEDNLRDLAIFRVLHDAGRSPALAKFLGHEAHGAVYVMKEHFIAGAKVIEPRFTVGRFDEAVLGAFAVADESNFAAAAVFGQRIQLIPAELSLLSRYGQPGHVPIIDIAQKVFRLYKVIA